MWRFFFLPTAYRALIIQTLSWNLFRSKASVFAVL
jgi:hypothetical protein